MRRISVSDEVANGYAVPTMTQEPSNNRRGPMPSPVTPSLAVNGLLLFVASIAAFLFSRAILLAKSSPSLQASLVAPPPWLLILVTLVIPLGYFFIDSINALANRFKLPFAGSRQRAQRIYAHRVHLILLTFYFSTILVALCWSAPAMAPFSKLFLAAVFSISIFSLGKSIPSTRLSFMLSGALFVVVLVATQTFIVHKMQIEQEAAEEDLREQLEFQNDNRRRR